MSLSCNFTLHAGLTGTFHARLKCESINQGWCILNESKLIKGNQQEVRGLIDVSATLRHKEDRKGGFGSRSCVLMALLWQRKGLCCGRGADQHWSGGGGGGETSGAPGERRWENGE